MNITLSPATEKLLQQKLSTGAYNSADDLLHAALQALDKLAVDSLDSTALDAIDRSEDQIDQGMVHDWKDVRAQVRSQFLGN